MSVTDRGPNFCCGGPNTGGFGEYGIFLKRNGERGLKFLIENSEFLRNSYGFQDGVAYLVLVQQNLNV